METKELDAIITLITAKTGIIPRESHKSGIMNFIEKRLREIDVGGGGYYQYISLHQDELVLLLNHATVNETYFFREEPQFALLKAKILPELRAAVPLAPVRIWSAAASSGEEIYSLYLLATALGIRTECIASDINTLFLEKCAAGQYRANSVKQVDGAGFHVLLSPYMNERKEVSFPPELCAKIERRQINLARAGSQFPRNINLVFLRNVFVYFTMEMRLAVLQKIADETLAPGGYLFLSSNEISTIDSARLPKSMEKCSNGTVFYLHKKR